jgi:TorA maturation chaperone TorD
MAMPVENLDRKSAGAVLASLLASYPSASFAADAETLLADPDLVVPEELRALVAGLCADTQQLDALRSDYIDLFDRNASQNPIHETEWSRDRSLGKSTQLADLSGFYQAFGVELGAEGGPREMADHAGVELEFYAILLLKERHLVHAGDADGVEIVHDARRKFLDAHLGTFLGALADLPAVADHPHYGTFFGWCRDLVAADCKDLGVTPTVVSRPDGKAVEEDILCCGALGRSEPKRSVLPEGVEG